MADHILSITLHFHQTNHLRLKSYVKLRGRVKGRVRGVRETARENARERVQERWGERPSVRTLVSKVLAVLTKCVHTRDITRQEENRRDECWHCSVTLIAFTRRPQNSKYLAKTKIMSKNINDSHRKCLAYWSKHFEIPSIERQQKEVGIRGSLLSALFCNQSLVLRESVSGVQTLKGINLSAFRKFYV